MTYFFKLMACVLALAVAISMAPVQGQESTTTTTPTHVVMPSVIGDQGPDARRTLENRGFLTGTYFSSVTVADPGLHNKVVFQTPRAGTRVLHGSTAFIHLGRYEAPPAPPAIPPGSEAVSVPDLSGLTAAQADESLRAVGLVFDRANSFVQGQENLALHDTVHQQVPAAGVQVVLGSEVTVHVYKYSVAFPSLDLSEGPNPTTEIRVQTIWSPDYIRDNFTFRWFAWPSGTKTEFSNWQADEDGRAYAIVSGLSPDTWYAVQGHPSEPAARTWGTRRSHRNSRSSRHCRELCNRVPQRVVRNRSIRAVGSPSRRPAILRLRAERRWRGVD